MIAYKKLLEISKKRYIINSILMLLEWDQEVNMPANGAELRAAQKALLSEEQHQLITSDEIRGIFQELIDPKTERAKQDGLDANAISIINELYRDHLLAIRIPDALVKERSELTVIASQIWQKARSSSDFSMFEPHLTKIFELCKKESEALGYDEHPYDALLDQYECKMTTQSVEEVFDPLKKKLLDLIPQLSAKNPPERTYDQGVFPIDEQEKLCRFVIEKMGLGSQSCHISKSAHPFCLGCYPEDVRFTTAYHEEDFKPALFAAMHECGHGIYEHGLPMSHHGTPLCEYASMGIHESQSLFWEICIGQSREFWEYLYPIVQKHFPSALSNVSLDAFYPELLAVKPSLIRIHADKVTYLLHVILRFEIERDLLGGVIEVKDLPKIWNEKMEAYLNITPPSDRLGVLQDVHWSAGLVGYFPSYAFGLIAAAQLFKAFQKEHPEWGSLVRQGEFGFIKQWLQEHIHRHGRRHSPGELIKQATGETLSPIAYFEMIESRY